MQLLLYPHPVLRQKLKLVRHIDSILRQNVHEMFDLLYASKGMGLAANQVGLSYRLFILNTTESESVFINPMIIKRQGNTEVEEGCLSFPEIYGLVRRAKKICISAYNLSGMEITCNFTGIMSAVAQHEYDHLDGVLFIDRVVAHRRAEVIPRGGRIPSKVRTD